MSTTRTCKPTAPRDLGPAGRDVSRRLTGKYDFAPHEAPPCSRSAARRTPVAAREALVQAQGMTGLGHTGQPRLNPAIAEARQGRRLALTRLAAALNLPDESESTGRTYTTSTSKRRMVGCGQGWITVDPDFRIRPRPSPASR